jgi:hypothetical protein
MANQVYANGREVACKAAAGKAIAAFPDVCMTPPENPATPPGVPVPYPNTGMASDTTDGSTSVKISGKEVLLKDKSHFKKSSGDEAGSAAKKGVVTSVNRGKVYFTAWSMDVKFEGLNVVRHLDMTTHNHASFPSNTGPWPYLDKMAVEAGGACEEDAKKEKAACEGIADPCATLGTTKPKQKKRSREAADLADKAAADECLAARRCFLQPYEAKASTTKTGCCHPQTGHHLIEASSLFEDGRGDPGDKPLKGVNTGTVPYNEDDAPCVCAEGTFQYNGTHGLMHTLQSAENAKLPTGKLDLQGGGETAKDFHKTTYKDARKNGVDAMKKVFPESGCKEGCLEKQLDNYHKQCGLEDDTPVKAVTTGNRKQADVDYAEREAKRRSNEVLKQRYDDFDLDAFADSLGIPSFPFR